LSWCLKRQTSVRECKNAFKSISGSTNSGMYWEEGYTQRKLVERFQTSQAAVYSFSNQRILDKLDKVVKGKRRDEKITFCLYKLEENVLSLRNTSETIFSWLQELLFPAELF
jgi:hypothetical protein